MIVMVVTACPPSVRGDLSRWLFEVSTGVFVGHVSARVREALWTRVTAFVNDGKAIMAYSASNEQHVAFRVLSSMLHFVFIDPAGSPGIAMVWF